MTFGTHVCAGRTITSGAGELIPLAAGAKDRLAGRVTDEATTLVVEMRERIGDHDMRCAVLEQALYLEVQATL